MQRNNTDTFWNIVLVIVLLLGAMVACGGIARGQVSTEGQPEIQIQYPVYLPLVNGIQPVVNDMTCKVTEMLPDGGWIETCTQPIAGNRLLICTVEYAADWRVVFKQCIIAS